MPYVDETTNRNITLIKIRLSEIMKKQLNKYPTILFSIF